jgi:hypothetical protein
VNRAGNSRRRSTVAATAVTSALALLALLSDAGAAVTLNPRGLGQVLIYPYYTVNAGFGTLLSVINTTPNGKALKLRFHEGRNGRTVFDLNVYLSPFDVWVAQVYSSGDESSVASIATNDSSCVMPAFLLPVDPGSGLPRANFGDAAYSGANADGGPAGPERTREGFFDVIEMGEVTDAVQHSLTAITHDGNGVPASCEQIHAAWSAPGGYWGQNAQTDLAPPTGGLYGAASIIDIAEGLMYTIDAAAIDGFSTAIQHTGPGDASPDLIEADFARPEDAVSALLTADTLYNEFVVDAGIGARTDWVVTLPTKRFYTDPALLAATLTQIPVPFDAVFGGVYGGTACSAVAAQPFNREEVTTIGCELLCPPHPELGLCFNTNAMALSALASPLGSNLSIANDAFVSRIDATAFGFRSGWLRLDLTTDSYGSPQSNHVLAAINGPRFRGLPAIGFAAVNYVNANAAPGVLANYSGALPHRAHLACISGATANPCE